MRDAINQERDELVRDNENLPRDSEMSTGQFDEDLTKVK